MTNRTQCLTFSRPQSVPVVLQRDIKPIKTYNRCTTLDTQRGTRSAWTSDNNMLVWQQTSRNCQQHCAIMLCHQKMQHSAKCLLQQLAVVVVVVVALKTHLTSVHELGHKHAVLLHTHLLCCLLSIWCCQRLHQHREDPVFYVATNAFNTRKHTWIMTCVTLQY